MNADQLAVYVAAAMSSLSVGVLLPLLILLGISAAIWLLFSRAQRAPDFDISEVLRDETNKVSSKRVITFMCFAVSSWVLAVIVFALPQHVVEAYAIYMAFWSGAVVAEEFIKRKWPTATPTTGETTP